MSNELQNSANVYNSEVVIGKYYFNEELVIKIILRDATSLELLSWEFIYSGVPFIIPIQRSSKGNVIQVEIVDDKQERLLSIEKFTLDESIFYELSQPIIGPNYSLITSINSQIYLSHDHFIQYHVHRMTNEVDVIYKNVHEFWSIPDNREFIWAVLYTCIFIIFLVLSIICTKPTSRHYQERFKMEKRTKKLLKNNNKNLKQSESNTDILVLLLKDESFVIKN